MSKFFKQIKSQDSKLYNKILFLSRNKLFYTKFCLNDTFQNRINLIFLHISFLFNKIKQKNKNLPYKEFCQRIFDFTFRKIELNMREVGFGDIAVNKNMKFMVGIFYEILLNCENYKRKDLRNKNLFLLKYLAQNTNKESIINDSFDKFNNKKKTMHIEKKGISAKILLILVFFAVRTFKP